MLVEIALGWLTLSPPIQRPSPSVPLSWEAPAECPSLDELRERVERFAPGILDTRDASASRIDVHVEARGDRYGARVEIANVAGESERSFEARDCEVVTDAVALLIAVALDPVRSAASLSALREPPAPEPPAPVEPAAPEPPAPVEPADPEPPAPVEPAALPASLEDAEGETSLVLTIDEGLDRDPSQLLRVALRVFGTGGLGPTNTGYGGIGGGVALLGDRWRVELTGAWSIPRQVPRTFEPNQARVGGSFDGWAVAARGCFVPTVSRLELPLCPGVELGQVRGRGLPELPVALDASFVWIALGLGQGLWFALLERFAFGIELNVAAPLRRGRFLVEDVEIQRIPPVTVHGLLGVELRLP